MDQAMIQAVLDEERPDLAAIEVALVERARDLLLAAELLHEYPETARRLIRTSADCCQQYARTVEIAVRVCANREHVDADCEHSEE